MEHAYYMEPEDIGRKAFLLLREVLADKDLTAICKVVIKDREALAAIDPFGPTMLLTTIHWPDEIRDGKRPGPACRGARVQGCRAPDGRAAGGRDDRGVPPERYHDEYREALMKVIESKVEGREVAAPGAGRGGQPGRPHGRSRRASRPRPPDARG